MPCKSVPYPRHNAENNPESGWSYQINSFICAHVRMTWSLPTTNPGCLLDGDPRQTSDLISPSVSGLHTHMRPNQTTNVLQHCFHPCFIPPPTSPCPTIDNELSQKPAKSSAAGSRTDGWQWNSSAPIYSTVSIAVNFYSVVITDIEGCYLYWITPCAFEHTMIKYCLHPFHLDIEYVYCQILFRNVEEVGWGLRITDLLWHWLMNPRLSSFIQVGAIKSAAASFCGIFCIWTGRQIRILPSIFTKCYW